MNGRSTSSKTRVRGCLTHHCSDHLSSCQLCWCHLCQLGVHEDEIGHVEVGDQLDVEDSWWSSSANCSAQFVLSHSRYSCSERSILLCDRFLSLIGIKWATSALLAFCMFINSFSLPGTLVSAIEVVPVCFRQHCVNKVGSYFLLCGCVALWWILKCTMWSKYVTHASDQVWASWDSL